VGDSPWLFVSPYCQNGSLVTYLKRLKDGEEFDLLRCVHQVAKRMEYLHRKGVLHGDLKGANVLVDDNRRYPVSDFGQSEKRSEVYRLTGTPDIRIQLVLPIYSATTKRETKAIRSRIQ